MSLAHVSIYQLVTDVRGLWQEIAFVLKIKCGFQCQDALLQNIIGGIKITF
jgi:hypothetical protein